MKRLIFLIFLLYCSGTWAQIITDTCFSTSIRTVSLSLNGVELSQPVVHMETTDRLLLVFDELSAEHHDFQYRFFHCNRDWEKDELEPYEYVSGFEYGSIENYNPSFTTLEYYFNYSQFLPAQYSIFLVSGNYCLEVFLQDDPDSVVLRKRFWVTEDAVKTNMDIHVPTSHEGQRSHQEVSVSISPKDGDYLSWSPRYFSVRIRQNGRLDMTRELKFFGFSGQTMNFQWDVSNVFPGGNSFRYFDLSNIRTPMYNVQKIERFGSETFAILKPDEDRSDQSYTANMSLNGGMKVNVWDRNNPSVEADYVWVTFSLPMPRPFLNGNIYIMGELTQWKLGEESKMEWNPNFKAYTKRLFLKQGYYSYQLHFLPIGEKTAYTSTLEGDFFENTNNYTVFVYYRGVSDRYDRLLNILIR